MLVHVAFTPGEQTPAPVGIVVDVLRATSTMTQALASGYRRVLCCAEIEEARTLAQSEGPAKLAGERRLEHIEGFDFGNSPREVAGKPAAETLILSTTNGTRLLVSAAERFEHVYVGSLLNLDAVAAAAREHGRTSQFCAPACSASSRSTTRTAPVGSPRHSAGTPPTRRTRRFESRSPSRRAHRARRKPQCVEPPPARPRGRHRLVRARERSRRRAALRPHDRACRRGDFVEMSGPPRGRPAHLKSGFAAWRAIPGLNTVRP